MTEAQLQAAVIELARRLGWHVARFPAANWTRTRAGREFVRPLAYDTKGFPDCLLARDRLVAAEFKAEGEKPTVEQAAWQEWLTAAGVAAYVWKPRDWASGAVEAGLR